VHSHPPGHGAHVRNWPTAASRGTGRECPLWCAYLPKNRDRLRGRSRPVAVLKEILMEGVSELDTRPTPSPARTADPTSEHIASVAEGSDGDWYGREPHAAARRDKIIGACFDEACRPLSNWRRRSSRAAVQHAPHHRSTRLALGAEAAYRAGSIPGVRRQRVCMTAIPKLLFAEDVSCKK
jgi:hypothetical protein